MEAYFKETVDGCMVMTCCSLIPFSPLSSDITAVASVLFNGVCCVGRRSRRSSFVAKASNMNGDKREKLSSNSRTEPSYMDSIIIINHLHVLGYSPTHTSFICSSIAVYSSPFCKSAINVPGGISDCATLDLATKDS